jgi:L-rhamnose mutarotase
MKVGLHSVLREGQEEAYEREHAEILPDVLAALRRVGVREWVIWRSGGHLFHMVEADDFAAAMAALEHDPVNERGQEHMAGFVDHFEPNPDGPAGLGLRHVWTMSEQAG